MKQKIQKHIGISAGGFSHEIYELTMPFMELPIFSLNDHHDFLQEIDQKYFHQYAMHYIDMEADESHTYDYASSYSGHNVNQVNQNVGIHSTHYDNNYKTNDYHDVYCDLLNDNSHYQEVYFTDTNPHLVNTDTFINDYNTKSSFQSD